ncbi:MAG: hypothetical protein Q8807_01740 ['Waltheria sp.' little leaf phytoplasma]|nr:hypothetical protein ['Waltheria sp.' little leaf phytoplasma]MDV3166382.1 hypothetical protein ['Waltheria sp.' little leaf phytoplasma]
MGLNKGKTQYELWEVFFLGERCENCDKTTQLQIHHIGTIRNTHRQRIMNKVLCKDCHRQITNQQIHDIRKNKNNKNK